MLYNSQRQLHFISLATDLQLELSAPREKRQNGATDSANRRTGRAGDGMEWDGMGGGQDRSDSKVDNAGCTVAHEQLRAVN